METKFNPWHDPDNGQFTFAEGGVRSQGGGGMANKPDTSLRQGRAPEKSPNCLKERQEPLMGG
ncbi:MAG: hypothetical protein IPO50_05810 [Sphingomonadales bacterium]|nr:hypothetical protein [Sphingomonadales bacterium]